MFGTKVNKEQLHIACISKRNNDNKTLKMISYVGLIKIQLTNQQLERLNKLWEQFIEVAATDKIESVYFTTLKDEKPFYINCEDKNLYCISTSITSKHPTDAFQTSTYLVKFDKEKGNFVMDDIMRIVDTPVIPISELENSKTIPVQLKYLSQTHIMKILELIKRKHPIYGMLKEKVYGSRNKKSQVWIIFIVGYDETGKEVQENYYDAFVEWSFPDNEQDEIEHLWKRFLRETFIRDSFHRNFFGSKKIFFKRCKCSDYYCLADAIGIIDGRKQFLENSLIGYMPGKVTGKKIFSVAKNIRLVTLKVRVSELEERNIIPTYEGIFLSVEEIDRILNFLEKKYPGGGLKEVLYDNSREINYRKLRLIFKK